MIRVHARLCFLFIMDVLNLEFNIANLYNIKNICIV